MTNAYAVLGIRAYKSDRECLRITWEPLIEDASAVPCIVRELNCNDYYVPRFDM